MKQDFHSAPTVYSIAAMDTDASLPRPASGIVHLCWQSLTITRLAVGTSLWLGAAGTTIDNVGLVDSLIVITL